MKRKIRYIWDIMKRLITLLSYYVFFVLVVAAYLVVKNGSWLLGLPIIAFALFSLWYITTTKEKDYLTKYAKYSFYLIGIWFPLTYCLYYIETGEILHETISDAKITFLSWGIVLANLLLSFFVIFFGKVLKESIYTIKEKVEKRRWDKIVFFNLMLWVYTTWAFAVLYNFFDNFFQCLCIQTCCNTDKITGLDLYYFSLSNLTTLGIGDLIPCGGCKILVGIEALTGFILISVIAGIIVSVIIDH